MSGQGLLSLHKFSNVYVHTPVKPMYRGETGPPKDMVPDFKAFESWNIFKFGETIIKSVRQNLDEKGHIES